MMAALPSCSVRCFFSEFETNDDTIILVLFRSLDTPQVFNLNNKSVSWVRSMDSHILTVDRETFISDHRSYHIYNLLFYKRNLFWALVTWSRGHISIHTLFVGKGLKQVIRIFCIETWFYTWSLSVLKYLFICRWLNFDNLDTCLPLNANKRAIFNVTSKL